MKESLVVNDEEGEIDDEEEGVEEEEETTSESVSLDAGIIKSKFATLASALQETNQNLVTFEYLLEHYKKHEKPSTLPKENAKDVDASTDDNGKEDIVNLLKDICGSVNDLRSEMGNNISTADCDLKTQNILEFSELKDKSNKLEFEVECLKSKLTTSEEKYLEEKRKNVSLEEIIQEQKAENRKLGMFLKEADEFSKESERECMYLKKEILDIRQDLQKESTLKESLTKDFEKIKNLYDEYDIKIKEYQKKEEENVQIKNLLLEYEERLSIEETEKQRISEQLMEYQDHIKQLEFKSTESHNQPELPPLDLDGLPTTSRSTLSSKSEVTDEKSNEELKESHKRLKHKTRQLLKQYRHKRSQLDKKDKQLALQKAGLIKLQSLHQSVESNHYIVIHHLGQQLVQIAKLVATLWPESENVLEDLFMERENKLSEWILYIDNLSSWIVQKLVTVQVRKREKIKTSLDVALSEIENTKQSLDISEAAKNEDSKMFQEIQKELFTGLQEAGNEQTDADTSLGTWM